MTEQNERTSHKTLGVEKWLFLAGIAFFLPVGLVYGLVTDWEPVGSWTLLLLCGLYGMVGAYLWLLSRSVDPRPEDDPHADVEDHAGELGVYSPHSWWPLVAGVAVTLVFGGVAIGWWVTGIGVVVGIIAIVGFTYEFSRGQHAH